jgi:Ca2+-transporting ATPase
MAGMSSPQRDPIPWHSRTVDEVLAAFNVTIESGLNTEEATLRLARYGQNRFPEAAEEPSWHKLARILREPLNTVLAVAAATSAVVSSAWETPAVILAVVVFNAALNLIQERRAEASLKALQHMTVTRARVRRDGRTVLVEAANLVPGDLVELEAGDLVPADGRLVEAECLEVKEAALTGESQPVGKNPHAEVAADASAGDRISMVFMNTAVTRGRATYVVTSTALATQIGRIAELLSDTKREQTPLQRQMALLARTLTQMAVAVVGVVFLLGAARGYSLTQLFLVSVSLAVATIPEGLSAVVAFTLATGAARLAKQGAIVKNLSAVETLGSTAHICTDKTGTLTLNEMTARYLFVKQGLFVVTGEGYAIDGHIMATNGGSDGAALAQPVPPPPDVREALLTMAICGDAVVTDGQVLGDPTEGALVVLAKKGGLDVEAARATWPRVAEIPFESAFKYMATFHHWPRVRDMARESSLAIWAEGFPPLEPNRMRLLVKGAPDVVIARCTTLETAEGPVELGEYHANRVNALVRTIGGQGLRVLALARRDIREDAIDLENPGGGSERAEALREQIRDLSLIGLVALEDPARPEARAAIETARRAGISVHMITGDHIGTASAIAAKLRIVGEALNGAQLDVLDDATLAARAPGIGILARASPDHKIRVVRALQTSGAIVAMTGDGVNDAPALKQADIGVAMGVTGTEVAKGAASMILVDDNFVTIVDAVRQGRGIYANIVKFAQFQLATAWGFVLVFVATGLLGAAHGAPFSALQILWVNLIMDGPPALALGADPTPADAMQNPPRPFGQQLLTRGRILRILLAAVVMAVGSLSVLLTAPGPAVSFDRPSVAGTLTFTTFVFFQVFNLLNVRAEHATVFSRYSLTNGWLWAALTTIIVLQILVVQVPFLRPFFTTTPLTLGQWLLAATVASSILWIEEGRKMFARYRRLGARSRSPLSATSSSRTVPISRFE